MATSRTVLKSDAVNRIYAALMSVRNTASPEQAKAIADVASNYAEMLNIDQASTGSSLDVQRFYAAVELFAVMIGQTPPADDSGSARTLAAKAVSFAGFASESSVPDSIIDNIPPEQVRHVSKGGSDANGTGSIDRPYLTIQAAEASITDASTTKLYLVKIGPGEYSLPTSFTSKKINVYWKGASRRMTFVRARGPGQSEASGIRCIVGSGESGSIGYEGISFATAAQSVSIERTGGVSGTCDGFITNCRLAGQTAVKMIGLGPNAGNQWTFMHAEINGSVLIQSGWLYSVATYIGGRVTGEENPALADNIFNLDCATISGNQTVTFNSPPSGLPPGMRVTGANIPLNTVTSLNPNTANSVLLIKAPTSTEASIILTFNARKDSIIELFDTPIIGVTMKKLSSGYAVNCYNRGSVILNDAGTEFAGSADVVRSSTQLVQDLNTVYTRTSETIGMGYVPTTSSDWDGTAPVSVREAVDRLAALVKTLNSGTGA